MKRDKKSFNNSESEALSLPEITIKVKSVNGCYHREHSPVAYKIIDDYLARNQNKNLLFEEHESGPEIIAWLVLGAAGLTVAKSVIDLITSVINARAKGREKGNDRRGDLLLVIRSTHRTAGSTEERVMEIHDNDVVTPEQVQTAIELGINKIMDRERGKD